MLVIFNDSPKKYSKQVRALVGRYCWKIARDVWVWPQASIRYDILKSLRECSEPMRIIFVWKDSTAELGYRFKTAGNMHSRQNEFGLFNHKSKFDK